MQAVESSFGFGFDSLGVDTTSDFALSMAPQGQLVYQPASYGGQGHDAHKPRTGPPTGPPVARDAHDKRPALHKNQSLDASVAALLTLPVEAFVQDDSRVVAVFSSLGTLLCVTPAASIYLGIHADHLAGLSIMDFVHPEDLDQFISFVSAIVSNGTCLQMLYRLKHSGTSMYQLYEGVGRPFNAEIDGFQGIGEGMVLISKPVASQPVGSSSNSSVVSPGTATPTNQQQAAAAAAAAAASAGADPVSPHHNSQPQFPHTPSASFSQYPQHPSAAAAHAEEANLWSRRQATRMQKGLNTSRPPTKLEYQALETAANPSPHLGNPGNPEVTPAESVYVSPLMSGGPGYTMSSPFDDASTASSSFFAGNLPASATPSMMSFDESSNQWSGTMQPGVAEAPAGYAGPTWSRSYSYFDVNSESAVPVEESKSPRAQEPVTYWDNVINSELVSPNYYFMTNNNANGGYGSGFVPSSISPTSSHVYMDASNPALRGKSYSLPGLFDVAPSRYGSQYPQPPPTPSGIGGLDLSGYSMAIKTTSPGPDYGVGPGAKSMRMGSGVKTPKGSKMPGRLDSMAPGSGAISKPRRKSKPQHREDSLAYVCAECGVKESPEWRKGPNGPKTLCNACGLRWAKLTRQKSISDDLRRK